MKQLALIGLVFIALGSACGQGQVGGLYQLRSFDPIPQCATNDMLVPLENPYDEPLEVLGVAVDKGTDATSAFSVEGVTIGDQAEIGPNKGNSLSSFTVPPQTAYQIRFRYRPLEQGEHQGTFNIAFTAPHEGVLQIQLSGKTTEEVADCPTVVKGTTEGVSDGPYFIYICWLAAATSAVDTLIASDAGAEPYEPVVSPATLAGGSLSLEPFDLQLPEPNESDEALAQLRSVINGNTDVTVSGIDNGPIAATLSSDGHIDLTGVEVSFADDMSTMDLTLDLTTRANDRGQVPNARLVNDFNFNGQQVLGIPLQENGSFFLVGLTTVAGNRVTGPLAAASGLDMVVGIEARLLPDDGSTPDPAAVCGEM